LIDFGPFPTDNWSGKGFLFGYITDITYFCVTNQSNMKQYFTGNCLQIYVRRSKDNQIIMGISSDYSGSSRKSRLWVNEKSFAENVLTFWRNINTKKLLYIRVGFDEIDYYDSMTDMYEVPTFSMKRGLRKVVIDSNSHGCIPKEWSIEFRATFADTKVVTPLLEVIKLALGPNFNETSEKSFLKSIRPFLQGKVDGVSW
jgi:hypothetical protein